MSQVLDVTPKAAELISELRNENGPLVFHLSGGCCDGSQPMCFAEGEFKLGSQDVRLGSFAGADLWMSKDQYAYWQPFILTLDVVPGRGSSFSLEIPKGMRFIMKSRLRNPVAFESDPDLEPEEWSESADD